ncbi:hypothetical protein [Nocardioides bizhenqiangii]|uniref:Uncharacterized protein n=1 Tax=Nocardioides bizhenqiangii TaxID=3095076 RepID=A0ABZ0ZU07_9ACTN|nr:MULTISPECIES: hypothetical protein [unclassified Nocardioides]MDZ5623647.1 hypothetical protein [Nocardioides sp. HM23]WQQ27787.1 hypothetical protein SHK19_06020 [Nocardioides sp. HM61]
MNEVSAICPLCDTTAVLPADAMVLIADDFEDDDSLAGWAMWTCDTCGDWSAVAVGRREFVALEVLGGRLDGIGHAAWPPAHLEQRPADRELCLDDLIEFHRLLEQPDWFEQLLRLADSAREAE